MSEYSTILQSLDGGVDRRYLSFDDSTITAASVPVYGLFTSNVWGCPEWVAWHKALVAQYGLDSANQMWLAQWNNQNFFATDYSWCKYDTDFANYMQSVGLADSTGDIIANTVVAGENVVANLENTATTTSKVIEYGVPILVGLVIIGAAWWGYNKFIKK